MLEDAESLLSQMMGKQALFLFFYIYVLNLSPEEAARMMKISVHGIYTHKGRALRALRKEMIGDADYG